MGKISRIHVLTGKKTTLQKSLICEALRAGIPVVIPEQVSTQGIFDNHNNELMQGLIDNELPSASFGVDPHDENFDKPLNNL